MQRDLRERTKKFALRIIKRYAALPRRGDAQVLGNQLLKAGTSVGAHYREACRGKSDADFISKIEGASFILPPHPFVTPVAHRHPSCLSFLPVPLREGESALESQLAPVLLP